MPVLHLPCAACLLLLLVVAGRVAGSQLSRPTVVGELRPRQTRSEPDLSMHPCLQLEPTSERATRGSPCSTRSVSLGLAYSVCPSRDLQR